MHPDVPVKTLPELVAYAKANPGKISCGTQGFGTGTHLLTELFKLEAGINIVSVPYRGTAPDARRDSGRRGANGHRSQHHHPAAHPGRQGPPARGRHQRAEPEIAGRADDGGGGLSEAESPFWLGVVAPAGTPPEIVNKLNAAFRESLNDPATRERLDALGAEIKIDTPEDFGRMIAEPARALDRRGGGSRHQG